jgi:hypothetical protein
MNVDKPINGAVPRHLKVRRAFDKVVEAINELLQSACGHLVAQNHK